METLRLTDQQRQMVADNHNLIYAFLARKGLPVGEYYDLAAIGLCKAAARYDPARGSFAALAWRAMASEVSHDWAYKLAASRTADVISLDACDTAEGLHGLIGNANPNDDPGNLIDAWYLIDRLRALASDRDRRVLAYRALGYNCDEIGPMVGLSRGGVSHATRMIRHRLGVYRDRCKRRTARAPRRQASETLCWRCAHSAGPKMCSWAREFAPVPGWDAEPTELRSAKEAGPMVRSNKVKACPLFEEG